MLPGLHHSHMRLCQPVLISTPRIVVETNANAASGSPSCYAVEKNTNAFVLLQHRNATDPLWGGRVHVVKSDMREWGNSQINGAGKNFLRWITSSIIAAVVRLASLNPQVLHARAKRSRATHLLTSYGTANRWRS